MMFSTASCSLATSSELRLVDSSTKITMSTFLVSVSAETPFTAQSELNESAARPIPILRIELERNIEVMITNQNGFISLRDSIDLAKCLL
jgi:hypothetical protein